MMLKDKMLGACRLRTAAAFQWHWSATRWHTTRKQLHRWSLSSLRMLQSSWAGFCGCLDSREAVPSWLDQAALASSLSLLWRLPLPAAPCSSPHPPKVILLKICVATLRSAPVAYLLHRSQAVLHANCFMASNHLLLVSAWSGIGNASYSW